MKKKNRALSVQKMVRNNCDTSRARTRESVNKELAVRVPVNSPSPQRSRGRLARRKRWQAKFLAALAKAPSVKHAARAAGVSRSAAYRQRESDVEFAARWDEQIEAATDELELMAFRSALAGDAQLLQFMLKCRRPQIYRELQRLEVDARHCGVLLLPAKEDKAP